MKLDLPENPELAAKIIQARADKEKRFAETGMFGWLVGSGKEKPGNVASVLTIFFTLMIVAVAFLPPIPDLSKRDLVTSLFALISGALGYTFGRRST